MKEALTLSFALLVLLSAGCPLSPALAASRTASGTLSVPSTATAIPTSTAEATHSVSPTPPVGSASRGARGQTGSRSILTSRQLAVVVWLVLFLVWALTVAGVRTALASLIKTIFAGKALVALSAIIGYNVAIVVWLQRVGFWDPTMLYDTVLFVAVGAIGAVMRAATQGVTYDARFFLKTILVNLEVIVLLQFLSDFFPFNFWIEFLVLIPLTTLLVMLVVVSEHQEGAEIAHRFFTKTQSVIGLALIAYVAWRVVSGFAQLMQAQVLFSLILPLVMSVFFVPILYVVSAVMAYENAFLMVSFKNDDLRLARWKKRRLLLRFGLRLSALQAFRRTPAFLEFSWTKDRETALGILMTPTHGEAE